MVKEIRDGGLKIIDFDWYKALPQQFVFLIKNILAHQPILPQLTIQGISILDQKCNNHLMRNNLTNKLFPGRQNKSDTQIWRTFEW